MEKSYLDAATIIGLSWLTFMLIFIRSTIKEIRGMIREKEQFLDKLSDLISIAYEAENNCDIKVTLNKKEGK